MAKGHLANQERLADMQAFGKDVGKRAGFKCEWCEGKENLRLWDYQPDQLQIPDESDHRSGVKPTAIPI